MSFLYKQRWIRRLLWLILLLAVVYIWTGRLLAIVIPQNRAGIEYWLTQHLATPVTIGNIQVTGHLLAMNIALRDIRLADTNGAGNRLDAANVPLTLKFCWIGIDGWDSLWHQQLRLRFLQLQGLNARIWQNENNQWRLSGLEFLQSTVNQSNVNQSAAQPSQSRRAARLHQTLLWLDALIAQSGLAFDDIHLEIEPAQLTSKWAQPSKWIQFLYGDVDANTNLMPQKLWMQRLTLHKQNQQYQLFSELTLLKTDPVNVTLSARINGQSLLPETWRAQAYLKLDNTDIKPWVSAQLPETIHLDALHGQTEAWLILQAGRLQQLRGRLEFDQARWRYQWRSYRLDHWQGEFDWQYDHRTQWSIILQPTTWQVAKQQWTLPALRLDRQDHKDPSAPWHFQLASVDIAPLHKLINAVAQFDSMNDALVPSVLSLLVPHHPPLLKPRSVQTILKQLEQLAPQGQMRNVSWWKNAEEQNWQLQLSDLALKPKQYWPGFSGLQAQIQGKNFKDNNTKKTEINLQLDSPQLIFDWPNIFRQPLPMAHVKGQAVFSLQPKQWRLQVHSLEAFNKDASGYGEGQVSEFVGEAPLLTLQAQLRHAHAKTARAYLPTKVMPESLVKWLENAVIDGEIEQADFLYQGRLQKTDNPLAKSLLMRYQVNNATLDYLPPWPRLEQAKGEVSVIGKNVEVRLQQAKVLGAQVWPSQLSIGEFEGEWRLRLQADAQGDAQTAFAILGQSPLQKSLASLLETVKPQGPLKTHLQLDVPFGRTDFKGADLKEPKKNPRPLWVNVRSRLENVDIDLPLWKLNAQKLNGEVTYDSVKGISIPAWQAVFFGEEVKGSTHTENDRNGLTVISNFSGAMPLQPFNDWLQQPLVALASGTSAYQAQLVLTPWQQMRSAFLQVDADLQGVQVALPSPFGLNGNQSLAVSYHQQLDPLQPGIEIRYGSWLHFLKQAEATRIYFGDTRLANTASLRDAVLPGISIGGRLPSIDLQQWMDIFPAREKTRVPSTSQNAQPWSERALSLRNLEVSLNNLRWKEVELGSTTLKITPKQQDWQVGIDSQNLDAQTNIPFAFIRHWADKGFSSLQQINTDHLLQMRVARVQLPLSTQPEILSIAPVVGSTPPPPAPLSPPPTFSADAFPAMQLEVAQIMRRGKNMGELTTRVQSSASGLLFQDLKAHIKQVNLQGRGQWLWQLASSSSNPLPQSSQFIGQVGTDNMLAFLSAWGYPPVIDAKTAQLNTDLSWPGNPADFVLSRLNGKLDVKMTDGRLLTVDNTTSSVRVVGLMNFETIIRRMQLDFSDLFKKGLAFDEITGNFVLANTQMHTDNFVLKGPAATFKVSGNADLLHRQLDHRLVVTLPVSRNLVLPAAATGGLPAAATAFLIEQALGDRLDKLTELTFNMQGSWQDPKIEKR